MTDREHVFFIIGYAQGNINTVKTYLDYWGISKSVFVECNEDLKKVKKENESRMQMQKDGINV